MAHKPGGSAADDPVIHHPQTGDHMRLPFVASGRAPRAQHIDSVQGRLVDYNGRLFPGRTLLFPDIYRWAIFFACDHQMDLTHPLKLEVFGVAINAQGLSATVWRCSADSLTLSSGGPFEIKIDWPQSGNHKLCPSNFVPYGKYTDAGTIAVTLGGGVTATTQNVQYIDGIWSAQFDPGQFPPLPTGPCTLQATLNTPTGIQYSPQMTDLVFQNC
jgi:hypothetical protein